MESAPPVPPIDAQVARLRDTIEVLVDVIERMSNDIEEMRARLGIVRRRSPGTDLGTSVSL